MYHLLVTLCACCVVAGSALDAQEPDTVLGRMSSGQRLRIHTTDGVRHQARLLDSSGTRYLWLLDRAAPIPLAAVDSIWIRKRATVEGMAAGGITFGLAGVVLLPVVIQSYYGEDSDFVWDDQAIVAVLATATLGAGIGALVGRRISKYSLVYPRRTRGDEWGRSAMLVGARIPLRLSIGRP